MSVAPSEYAVAVRAGEHACCRFAHAEDRERLAVDYVRDGLRRGHKVLYFHDSDDAANLVAGLGAIDADIAQAIASGQLEVRSAGDAYAPDGTLEVERMLSTLRTAVDEAHAQGYPGVKFTGEMSWALNEPAGSDLLAEYERRIAELIDGDGTVFFCQYDHGRFPAGALADVADAHRVDVSPELSAIGRDGCLAAARVEPSGTLRLAGELDFACAETLASVLARHYHGHLRLDLADLEFVDIAGMRALRGRKGQSLTIAGASAPVRRMLGLLGWDTDPEIEIAPAT